MKTKSIALKILLTLLLSNLFFDLAGQEIKGHNVQSVTTTTGAKFANTSNGTWIEYGLKGEERFYFKETNRDEWSVYITDKNRKNAKIAIDIFQKKVKFNGNPIYDIKETSLNKDNEVNSSWSKEGFAKLRSAYQNIDVSNPEPPINKKTSWHETKDDGCKGGKRQYSARINELGGLSWEDACASSPIVINGKNQGYPDRCDNHGFIGGMWGVWFVDDNRCSDNVDNTSISRYVNDHSSPNSAFYDKGRNWMKLIPNQTYVKDISIPGTHDSGAYKFWPAVSLISQCQKWNIEEQLNTGIRFFDIRCKKNSNGKFGIWHDFVDQVLSFDDVIGVILRFLKSNPSEGIVMRLSNEDNHVGAADEEFYNILNNYVRDYPVFFKGQNINPKLSEIRGKVYMLDKKGNNGAIYGNGAKYGNSNLDMMDTYAINKSPYTVDTKKKDVLNHLKKAATSEKWIINYLNGNCTSDYPLDCITINPIAVAKETNTAVGLKINQFKSKRKLGTIVSDYPSEQLVLDIINSNFDEVTTEKKYEAEFKVDGNDRIIQKRNSNTSTTTLRFSLSTASNVTWYKSIKIFDKNNNLLEEIGMQDDQHGPLSSKTYDKSKFNNTVKVEFWKAKAFGIHTHVATKMFDLDGLLGNKTSFTWMND